MKTQNELKIASKVQWITSLKSSWQNTFYPSLVKKIGKSDALLQDQFTIELIDLDKSKFQKIFLPMYKKFISSKIDYVLDEKKVFQEIYTHMNEGRIYRLMALYKKVSHEYCGGIVFSTLPDHIRIAHRVFDRKKTSKTKTQISVDYWMDAKLYDYAKALGKKYLRHGTDHFPRYGKSLGLCIFKLHIGSLPRLLENTVLTELTINDFESEKAIFYFESPDKNGFLKNAVLINQSEEIQNMLGTLTSLLSWAKIDLKILNGKQMLVFPSSLERTG